MRLRFLIMAVCVAVAAFGWSPAAAADVQVLVGPQRGGSYLGVGVADINAERAKALSLKEEYGVEVTSVESDSPAAAAGLRAGDVVLQYNGQRVEGMAQFMRLVRETPAGREVKLTVSRNGAQQTIPVKTGTPKPWTFGSGEWLSRAAPNLDLREFRMPEVAPHVFSFGGPRLGIEGHSVSGQLADYFGVKEGLLVASVTKGSAAERAGIRAGDVIVKVDDRTVSNQGDIRSALRSAAAASKRTVPVVVSREKREVTLNVTVDEPARGERVRIRQLDRRGRTTLI